MPVDVRIPQLGESITEAEIVRWLKADGEAVEVDEPIAEIETDKATAELPAPASGVLEIVAKEGSTVKPGDVVARIREGKADAKQSKRGDTSARDPVREAEPRSIAEAKGPATAASAEGPPATSSPTPPRPARAADSGAPPARRGAQSRSGDAEPETETRAAAPRNAAPPKSPAPARGSEAAAGTDTSAVDLSPAVRRLVEENHLDASRINGSGPGGRLTKEDVLAHLSQQSSSERPSDSAPRTTDGAPREAASRADDETTREIRDTASAADKSAHLSLVRGAGNAAPPPAEPAPRNTPAPAPAGSQVPARTRNACACRGSAAASRSGSSKRSTPPRS
jgi:2-oxoglutarate dehydrogenase E2 component (dihydrolipoamide succinyltransferase)